MGLCGSKTTVQAPAPPPAPDIGKASRDSMQAYIDLLPSLVSVQSEYAPQFADMARANSAAELEGQYSTLMQYAPAYNQLQLDMQNQSYDQSLDAMIKGLTAQYDFDSAYRPKMAQQNLDIINQFSPQYMDQALALAQQADGQALGIREQLGNQVAADLALGNSLSPEQIRQSQQAVRAGQAARGNTLGTAPMAQEVLSNFLAGEGLKSQRQSQAQNFYSGKSNMDFAQQALGMSSPLNDRSNLATQNPGFSTTNSLALPQLGAAGNSFDAMSQYQPMQMGQFGATNAYNNNLYNTQANIAMQNAQMKSSQPGIMGAMAGIGSMGLGLGAMGIGFGLKK